MGNCLKCNKKLGMFEGFQDFKGEYCSSCYLKGNNVLKKKEKSLHKSKEESPSLKKSSESGKWDYVLTHGGGFGLLMFLFSWFFTEVISNEEFYVGMHIIIWAIAGLIFGIWTWNKKNKENTPAQ